MTLLEHKDRIIKELFKPTFKSLGFKVSGNHYFKVEKEIIQVFNVQSSSFNLNDSVSFYLNIGLLFPIHYEITKESMPLRPKEYDCDFRIRSYDLTNKYDSYDLLPETNISHLENLLRSELEEYILPFFEKYKDIFTCKSLFEQFPYTGERCLPYLALTMIRKGEFEYGNDILKEYYSTTTESWKTQLEEFRNSMKA